MSDLIPPEARQAASDAVYALRWHEWDHEEIANAALAAAAPLIAEQARAGERERAEVAEAKLRQSSQDLRGTHIALNEETSARMAAAERAAMAEAKLEGLDKLHHPRRTTEIRPCQTHLPLTRANAVASHVCPDCVRTPAVYCSDIRCCGWPCEPHLVLHGETEETCTHRGGVEDASKLANSHAADFGEVSDGHGNAWPLCPADCDLHVVRPAWVQCRCEPREMPL